MSQLSLFNLFISNIKKYVGIGMILILVAFFREILGFGTVLGFRVFPEHFNNGLMLLAPGAFIILGLIIWAQRSLTRYVEE